MLCIRRDQRTIQVLYQRVIRRNQRRENRHHQQQKDNASADGRERIARHFADKPDGPRRRALQPLTAFARTARKRRIQRNGHDFVLGSKN